MNGAVVVFPSSYAFSSPVAGTIPPVLLSRYVGIVANDRTIQYYATNYQFTPP